MRTLGTRTHRFIRGMVAGVLLVAPLLLWQGCSKVDGDYKTNNRPLVGFVNNEPDADEVQTTFHIERYGFLMPDALVGFEEADPAQFPVPGAADITGVRFQLIHYQYLQMDAIDSLYVLDENGEWQETVPATLYSLDTNIGRYLILTQPAAGAAFHWELNTNYALAGDFTYRPVYSFSPMIFWKGSDPDGFVEEYRYTDYVYDSEANLLAFLANLRNDADLPGVDWVYTQNTQAVVNLTTQLGVIQKHALIVQSIDNDGLVSDPAYRIFNRSNRAPNTPLITYQKDGFNSVGQPESYTRHMIGWGDFIGDAPTAASFLPQEAFPALPSYNYSLTNWNGIRFLITGDDPDDQAFVTIPLQFHYELTKFAGDSAALEDFLEFDPETDNGDWVVDTGDSIAVDRNTVLLYDEYEFIDGWTDNSILELYNLESGYYQLRVLTRDDGLEAAEVPAWIRFRVHRMDPTRDILVMNLTPPDRSGVPLGGQTVAELGAFYRNMIGESLGSITNEPVVWSTDVSDDSYNCFYWELGNTAEFPEMSLFIPFQMMSDYRTVICIDDGYRATAALRPPIVDNLKIIAMDYLDMGGSLFWTGYSSLSKSFQYVDGTTTLSNQATKAGDFLAGYMGIQDVYTDLLLTFMNSRGDGLTAGIPEFAFLDTLNLQQSVIDVMRSDGSSLFNGRFDDGVDTTAFDWRMPLPGNCIPYVEAFSLYEPTGSQSVYTFNSYSAELDPRQEMDIFRVVDLGTIPAADVLFISPDSIGANGPGYGFSYSPAPDERGCWVMVPEQIRNLQDITIFNAYEAHNLSRADEMWAQPVVNVTLTIDARRKVFMYLQHQTIPDPVDYWSVGDTVSVDLLWQPILRKHRKVTTCYTENVNFAGNFGPVGGFATWTNFRTAFNTLPMYVLEYGSLGVVSPALGLVPGPGAIGLMQNVLYSFYRPKIQDQFTN